MRHSLIIFAKEPEMGKVKTRLSKHFSQSKCLNLYKAFLKDTVNLAKGISSEKKILAYESQGQKPAHLKEIARDFIFYRQNGKNLGEKMNNAFRFASNNGNYKIVIIGSDSPNLPRSFIKDAFNRLDQNDVVLGPSYDGGYYLIGLKKPCPAIFRGIKWSSNTVLQDTINKARVLKKKVSLLNRWYDIDSPRELLRLEGDLRRDRCSNAKWTKRFLKI